MPRAWQRTRPAIRWRFYVAATVIPVLFLAMVYLTRFTRI